MATLLQNVCSSQHSNVCVIYGLFAENDTKNAYVGSTEMFGVRMAQHRKASQLTLRFKDWLTTNRNMVNVVVLEVIEKNNPDLRKAREQYFIDLLKPSMNSVKASIVRCPPHEKVDVRCLRCNRSFANVKNYKLHAKKSVLCDPIDETVSNVTVADMLQHCKILHKPPGRKRIETQPTETSKTELESEICKLQEQVRYLTEKLEAMSKD